MECRNGLLGACSKVFSAVSDVCENRENEITKLSDKVKSGLYEINAINEMVEILWGASQIAYVETCKIRAVVKNMGEGFGKAVGKDVEKEMEKDAFGTVGKDAQKGKGVFEKVEIDVEMEKHVFEAVGKEAQKDRGMDLGL